MNKKLIDRLSRITGQIEAIKQELTKDDYDCEGIAQQLKAVSGGIKNFGKEFLKTDMQKCLDKKMSKTQLSQRLNSLIEMAQSV